MSGTNPDRSELNVPQGSEADACSRSYRAPINSPKPGVLSAVHPGTTLQVDVISVASASVLVVRDASNQIAGSLTFVGYAQVINCILQRGISYKAEVVSVQGGIFIVDVRPLP